MHVLPIEMAKKILREIKNDKGHLIQTQEEYVKEVHEQPKSQSQAPLQQQQLQQAQTQAKPVVSPAAVKKDDDELTKSKRVK